MVKVKSQAQVLLELSKREAKWLMGYLQNPAVCPTCKLNENSLQNEDPEDTEMRHLLFNAFCEDRGK